MRIYTNMAAIRAAVYLDKADKKSSDSIARLSSGYKINTSEDNPVGRAISNKLKMQINSLERSIQNASDGVSIVQTAEGALGEIHAMLERMTELAVQGSTDTYTDYDRTAIQNEIDQILDEIDRIAQDTDFNERPILDGTLSRKAYAEGINTIEQLYIDESVTEGRYGFSVTSEPEKAEYSSAGFASNVVPAGAGGSISLNGVTIYINEGDSIDDVYAKLKEGSYTADVQMLSPSGKAAVGEPITFTQMYYGSHKSISIDCSTKGLADFLGMDKTVDERGKDTEVTIIPTDTGFTKTAKVTSQGEYVTFTDKSDFEMTLRIDAGTFTEKQENGECRVAYNVTSVGAMTIQLGANEGQLIDIDIPKVSTETLRLDALNFKTSEGCSDAITKIGDAIAQISEIRSLIGAYQNRMEASIASLNVTNENMTSSLSTIADVNMAAEMTAYTTQNVLSQAATSMLAQANQAPEKVLQLLQ